MPTVRSGPSSVRLVTRKELAAKAAAREPLPKGSRVFPFAGKKELTRGQAALCLGVSKGTIRRLEQTGELPASRITGTVRYFDPLVVAAYAAKQIKKLVNPGDIAAQIFVLFEEGFTKREIVIRTRRTPEEVNALYLEWITPLGKDPREVQARRRDGDREELEAAKLRAQIEAEHDARRSGTRRAVRAVPSFVEEDDPK